MQDNAEEGGIPAVCRPTIKKHGLYQAQRRQEPLLPLYAFMTNEGLRIHWIKADKVLETYWLSCFHHFTQGACSYLSMTLNIPDGRNLYLAGRQ